MRQHTALTNMDDSTWSWDELRDWLKKTTKLDPDRKTAIEKVLAELSGITVLDEKTALAGFAGDVAREGARAAHSIHLKAGRSYQIDATGDFDTYLMVEDSKRLFMVRNEDVNYLVPILDARVIFTPAKDDVYRVVVTSTEKGAVGKYTLKIQEVVKIDKEVSSQGELSDKDERYQNKFAHPHAISLEANRPYTLEVETDQFSPFLLLYDSTGKKYAAENGALVFGKQRVARIDFTPHETASYVLKVTSSRPGEAGAYTLRVQGYGPKEK